MKDLNIKELRKEKGFSQTDLAKKIGVSRQTIVNYEKGDVIPETKKELLYNILQNSPVHFVNEEGEEYIPNMKGYVQKIAEIDEEIRIRTETIQILTATEQDYSHEQKMIELLKKQKNLIKSAEFNHKNNL
jgi:DNA-binding XRE family transcriptional regulator